MTKNEMPPTEMIRRYDVVQVIRVPEHLRGLVEIGDIGVVLDTYDGENFEIDCVTPDGSYKWLETLNRRYISKHLLVTKPSASTDTPLMGPSVVLGSILGTTFGAVIGAGLGAITMTLNGILVGFVIGLVMGGITGAATAALTVITAGTTGGVGVGYFTGMLFGGLFGMILGTLLPTSLRMRAHTEGVPILDALVMGRFETSVLCGFVLSILATIVGVWVAGKNLVLRNLK